MFFKSRMVFINAWIICFIALSAGLPVAFSSNGELPLPPNTQLTKKEARKLAGAEFAFSYYSSQEEVGQLINFYRANLPALGWKEKNILNDLGPAASQQGGAGLEKFLAQALMFEKGSDLLTVNFMPIEKAGSREVYYSLAQGALDLQAEKPPIDLDTIPELLDKPKKEVIPPYPGAALVTLSEDSGYLKATYTSKDSINSVIEFYRQNGSDYGWSLVEEEPARKLELDNTQAAEILYAEMIFTNQRHDVLRLGFSFLAFGPELPDSFDFTNIMVEYARKKK